MLKRLLKCALYTNEAIFQNASEHDVLFTLINRKYVLLSIMNRMHILIKNID